jgi:aldehyde:ferredoxin oxidoreductase
MVKFFENVYAALNSLHICHFTAFAVFLEPPLVKLSPTPVLKLLTQNITPVALAVMDISLWPELWSSVTGKRLGMLGFKKTGERIHVLERYMNTREGISRKDDTLPVRMLSEPRTCDHHGRTVPLEMMLKRYYNARGFDSNGIPKDRLLKKLGIEKK